MQENTVTQLGDELIFFTRELDIAQERWASCVYTFCRCLVRHCRIINRHPTTLIWCLLSLFDTPYQ